MANPNPPNNLKNTEATRFSGSKAAEMGRRGGIAAGNAHRKKKTCAEIAMRVINSELNAETRAKVEKVTGPLGDDEDTLYAAALAQVVTKAVKGDLKAFRELQNVVNRAQGAQAVQQREDDPLSAALKELGESL